MLPFTVTVSISLQSNFISSVNISNSYPDTNIATPYYFVAASSLDAILTLGER
jgi:hypothetical protein